MQYFISQIKILMPVLGFDIFWERPTLPTSVKSPESPSAVPNTPDPVQEEDLSTTPHSPIFYATTRIGCSAQAQIIDGEFTVLQGSIIHAQMVKRPNISAATQKQFDLRTVQHAKLLEA